MIEFFLPLFVCILSTIIFFIITCFYRMKVCDEFCLILNGFTCAMMWTGFMLKWGHLIWLG